MFHFWNLFWLMVWENRVNTTLNWKSESEKRIFDDVPAAAYLHSSDLWEVTSVEAIHLLQARLLRIFSNKCHLNEMIKRNEGQTLILKVTRKLVHISLLSGRQEYRGASLKNRDHLYRVVYWKVRGPHNHWGCLSHKQKGARARWQLVYYQIYLPAIDTLVTGMPKTANVLWNKIRN